MAILESQPQPERFAQWMTVFLVGAGIAALCLDLIYATAQILFDPSFLRGFGFFMVQVTLVSAVGGGIGATLAELALRNRWVTESAIRFLRLGLWLPFFGAWATPTWSIKWSDTLSLPYAADPILRLAIPTIATTLFAASYYHLTARYTLQLNRRSAVAHIIPSVVLHTVFFAFVAQGFLYPDGWRWFPTYTGSGWWPSAAAAFLPLAGCLLVLVWGSSSRFDKTAKLKGIADIRQILASNWESLLGAGLLCLLCFAFWNVFYVFLRDVFMIAPLRQVIKAAFRLLTTGSLIANRESTLWPDLAVSAQEIGEGVLLSGILAFILVKVVEVTESRIRLSWLFAFTHTVPIIIAIRLISWVGPGHWLRAVIIAAASLFPFTQTLWGLRTAPLFTRTLVALNNALPYVVFGMLFGELWASTDGLGFFIVFALVRGNRTEALAASLIMLGLMIPVSFILRLILKRLITPESELMLVGKSD
jgi:ABC-type nitrate/sulfonate/bicarbonate transport system permease component